MGVHALQQVIRDVKHSLDSGPRHAHIGMPALFKKQKSRLETMTEKFKQMDRDGAKVANAEARKTFRDKPHDLKKDPHPKGAGDQHLRDHALDEVLDNVGKALKDLKADGDLGDRVKTAGKELVRGLNSTDAKLKLLRTYMLALKGQMVGVAEGAATTAVASALYEVYLEGTPAAEALSFEDFNKYASGTKGLAKKAKGLPGQIDGHKF